MTPGKRRYTLIPVESLRLIADVLTMGAAKHGDEGWRDGDKRGEYRDALLRHFEEYRSGVWLDPDSTWPHLAHVGANALILLALEIRANQRG